MTPPKALPVWVQWPLLAEFIKGITIHCNLVLSKLSFLNNESTSQHTKYKSSRPYSFRHFLYIFPIVNLYKGVPSRGGAIFDPRGMIGRICVELYLTSLHQYTSFGSSAFREEFFFQAFPMMSLWQIMTLPGRDQYGPQGNG